LLSASGHWRLAKLPDPIRLQFALEGPLFAVVP
jgi:hypothetical protein